MRRLEALVLSAALLACAGAPVRPDAPGAPAWNGVAPGDAARLRARFGIELLGLRAAAAGYLLELRCRARDASLAAPLVEGRVPVRLVEGDAGAQPVPGRLVARGEELAVLLAPSGAPVGEGARVKVAFGDLEVAGLPVE